MEEMGTAYNIWVRKPEGKRSLWRPRFVFVFIIYLNSSSVTQAV
jgi:hypothetical protein